MNLVVFLVKSSSKHPQFKIPNDGPAKGKHVAPYAPKMRVCNNDKINDAGHMVA